MRINRFRLTSYRFYLSLKLFYLQPYFFIILLLKLLIRKITKLETTKKIILILFVKNS